MAPKKGPNTEDISDPDDVSDLGESENTEGQQPPEEEEKVILLAKREDSAVGCLRMVVTLLLVLVALGGCLSVYFVTKNSELQDFEDDFLDTGGKVVESFATTVNQRFEIMENFAQELSSRLNSNPDFEWPFATLPDYGIRAGNTARMGKFLDMTLVPKVRADQLERWNNYSMTNSQWLPESLALQEGIPQEDVKFPPIGPVSSFNPMAQTFEPLNATEVPGPYYLKWQSYPAVRTVYNVDLGPLFGRPISSAFATGEPVFTKSIDTYDHARDDVRRQSVVALVAAVGGTYEDDAFAPIFFPVFNSVHPNDENRQVAAVLRAAIYWKTYFQGILPASSKGIVVVLESSCGGLYTYQIDGSEATCLGRGDLHDTKYDYMEASVTMDSILGLTTTNITGQCQYGLRVYPSQPLEDEHMTMMPLVFALTLGGVFLVTCATFSLYDYCVQRRQRIVMTSAQQSGKLVHSLFPEDVRDRLYEEQATAVNNKTSKRALPSNNGGDEDWKSSKHASIDAAGVITVGGGGDKGANAIANLYEECTVLFADIAGFTSWSANRSPSDVFDLLETLYGSFDSAAKKLRVFKVETIGDCYVACTGLPSPQPDHAIIMAKFANLCLKRLRDLVRDKLMDRLGEDTSELTLRIGLHSGPVTAGVLRGDKARFQIFGDTVNTASRMESNGSPNMIHVSQATADFISKAGKESWLTKRDELVEAKGKGTMQTYWVNVQSAGTTSVASTESLGRMSM